MATADDVASAVIDALGPMTAMKLEKLAYYCQAWHLARHGEPLFDEEIQAWRQGPVVPSLYERHRGVHQVRKWPAGSRGRLTAAQADSVDWVVETYGRFTADSLSRMTHSELPWRVARGDLPEGARSTRPIEQGQMAAFYARHVLDPEAAAQSAVASAALEGIELDEQWQETLRDVTAGVITADAAVAAEVARATRA
jgi:uncharacterized phage-associated protein